MTDFFIYRSCDLTDLGVRQVLLRNADIINRAISLIKDDSGLPDDEAAGSDNPTLDIVSAEWSDPIEGGGTLPPGDYTYDAIPVDTCTGRTGAPIALPSLSISAIAAKGSIVPVSEDEISDGDTFVLNDGVNPAVTFEFDKREAPSTGSIVNPDAASIADGDTFVLNDGVNPAVTFEFDKNGSVFETPTLRRVALVGSEDVEEVRDLIIEAIANAPTLNMEVWAKSVYDPTGPDPKGRLELRNTSRGPQGNQTITQTGSLYVVGMRNGDGVVESATLRKIYLEGGEKEAFVGDKITEAINNAPSLDITATGSTTINLVNDQPGTAGNQPITQGGTSPLTVEGMSGGSDLGQVSTLRLQFGEIPKGCNAVQIRRNGVVVTPPFPLDENVEENVTFIDEPNPIGTYTNGTRESFERVSGADVQANDIIQYNGYAVTLKSVVGDVASFTPEIPDTLLAPPGFYTPEGRSGFYESLSTHSPTLFIPTAFGWAPKWPDVDFSLYWNGPLFSFRALNLNPFTGNIPEFPYPEPPYFDDGGPIDAVVQAFIDQLPQPVDFLSDIQSGDIIVYGSKTALVVHVERDIYKSPIFGYAGPGPQFGTVLLVPFGILPIPPLPAGQFWIVYRPKKQFEFGLYYSCFNDSPSNPINPLGLFNDFNSTGPSLVRGYPTNKANFLTADEIGPGDPANDHSRLNAFRVAGNGQINPFIFPPRMAAELGPPAALTQGQLLLVDGQVVTVDQVTEVIPPGFDENGNPQQDFLGNPIAPYFGEYEIEFSQPLSPEPISLFNNDINRPVAAVGPWFTIPSAISQFLRNPQIIPDGQYERLTRRTVIRNEVNIWQFTEDGSYQDRAGDVDGSEAKAKLDEVFINNNYPNGLKGLLDTIRGKRDTVVSDVFVTTVGDFTRVGNRLIAVNSLAEIGNGSIIRLERLRDLLDEACSSVSLLFEINEKVKSDGFAVLRMESREVQIPAAQCPPGQPDARETRLFCLGLASQQTPLQGGELARLYWDPRGRARNNLRNALRKLGLTDEEIDGALSLTPVDRVLSATELLLDLIQDLDDLWDLVPTTNPSRIQIIKDIFDEDRIGTINTGQITRDQIQRAIRKRGIAGVVKRPIGTDPNSEQNQGNLFNLIDDFALPMHNLGALIMKFNLSLNICDYEAALELIPDPQLRSLLGAPFAIIEDITQSLINAGQAILDVLIEANDFIDAAETLAGIIIASVVDPTLACLVGINGNLGIGGLPGISQVSDLIGNFAEGFSVKFNLSELFAQAISSVLCGAGQAVDRIYSLLGGTSPNAELQRAANCLPDPSVLEAQGITFPNLEVQVALECSLDNMNTLLDLIQAIIAEANELIDFATSLSTGFGTELVAAQGRQCSSNPSLEGLVQTIRMTLGV